jgi:hypothetical protein
VVPSTQETGVDEVTNLPTFSTWKRENLDQYATELTEAHIKLQEALEQLRLDLKDAMKELRKYQDDWK